MTATCSEPACERAPVTSSEDWVYTRCWDCISASLTSAFAVISWHERARAHTLPTAIQGGVSLDPDTVRDSATTSVTLGVALGLLIGKPVGIVAASWLAVRLGIAKLPRSVTWAEIVGVGFVAGIGFTVALFVNGLAFDDELQERGRLGILAGSLAASVLGFAILWLVTGREREPTDR